MGAVCFLSLGILSKIIPNGEHSGFLVLVFPCLMGFGRAVYESTNKGVFADFYPGEKSAGAFANVMMFGTLSSSITFLLNAFKKADYGIYLLIFCSVCTYPGIAYATHSKKRED